MRSRLWRRQSGRLKRMANWHAASILRAEPCVDASCTARLSPAHALYKLAVWPYVLREKLERRFKTMRENSSIADMDLVAEVAQSESPTLAMHAFSRFSSRLAGWRFVFGSSTGPERAHAIGKQFSGTAAVKTLFKEDAVLVVDEKTLGDFAARRQSSYLFDHSISLDTNAFSYIQPYIEGQTVPLGVAEVLTFIAQPDVNVDPEPYLLENISYLLTGQSSDAIFRKMKAYEVIRSV